MNDLQDREDLRAFEHRLKDIMSVTQPKTTKWRFLLAIVITCLAIGFYNWVVDPDTPEVSFLQSCWNHPLFTTSLIALVILMSCGIRQKIFYSDIMVERIQDVLDDYNMSCDYDGNLLLRPHPKAEEFEH